MECFVLNVNEYAAYLERLTQTKLLARSVLPVVTAPAASIELDAVWEGMRGMTCKAIPTHTPTI